MEHLEGYVDHIRFRNENNGYTVLSLDLDGDEETVVGRFPFLSEGEYISMEGEYTEHPMHGPQFQMRTYEITAPGDIQSMERYLGSGPSKEWDLRSQKGSQRSLRWIRFASLRRNRNAWRR